MASVRVQRDLRQAASAIRNRNGISLANSPADHGEPERIVDDEQSGGRLAAGQPRRDEPGNQSGRRDQEGKAERRRRMRNGEQRRHQMLDPARRRACRPSRR